MVADFLFKARDGQTPLPRELLKGLKIKTIQTIGELDEYEEENIAKGLIWLNKQKKDPIDYSFWITVHKRLFSDVWSWAGQIRVHELGNPDFEMPYNIRSELKILEEHLRAWIEFSSYPGRELAARFHERIETIHPFANGNCRFGRIIVEKLCRHYQFEIPSWAVKLKNDPELRRRIYIDALVKARYEKSFDDLSDVMFS